MEKITSDTEAIIIAKHVLKFMGDELDQKGPHATFCKDVLKRARDDGRKEMRERYPYHWQIRGI